MLEDKRRKEFSSESEVLASRGAERNVEEENGQRKNTQKMWGETEKTKRKFHA